MDKYRLSSQAIRQIRDIGVFTANRFGLYQAKAYHAGLERTFGLLADFPKMGASAEEVFREARRFRFQSHEIFSPRRKRASLFARYFILRRTSGPIFSTTAKFGALPRRRFRSHF
jgi:toxin ParE1/3/4